MKYTIRISTTFKKTYKLCKKRHYNMSLLDEAIELLATYGHLPQRYNPHQLQGKLKGVWSCHITPDWILLWDQKEEELTLYLMATGTHADLFKL